MCRILIQLSVLFVRRMQFNSTCKVAVRFAKILPSFSWFIGLPCQLSFPQLCRLLNRLCMGNSSMSRLSQVIIRTLQNTPAIVLQESELWKVEKHGRCCTRVSTNDLQILSTLLCTFFLNRAQSLLLRVLINLVILNPCYPSYGGILPRQS